MHAHNVLLTDGRVQQLVGGCLVTCAATSFGSQEMKYFRDKKVNIVDTTCPWVAKVCALPSVVQFNPQLPLDCHVDTFAAKAHSVTDMHEPLDGACGHGQQCMHHGYAQVWNSVDTYAKKNTTSVIHGKYAHEETVATASFASELLE